MLEINRDIIKLARESRGLSQGDLASKINIEQGTLSKIENSFLSIDEDILDRLSVALGYPKSFFLQKRSVHLLSGNYRKKITLPIKEVREQTSKMTVVEWDIEKLVESVDLPKNNIPKWDSEIDGSPTNCAKFLREYWKVKRGKIENLTDLIEDNGIVVVSMDLGNLDGLATFSTSGIPLIYVNNNRSGDRHRFNLAHELAHLIMHWGQKVDESRDPEEEAHEFASEFLVPSSEVKTHLSGLNLAKLAELKSYWKVSMQSLLVKAYKHLGVISKNQYYYLYKQMGYLGYKKKEPVLIPVEEAKIIKEIVELYVNELNYSNEEFAELINREINEVERLYLQKKPKVRLLYG